MEKPVDVAEVEEELDEELDEELEEFEEDLESELPEEEELEAEEEEDEEELVETKERGKKKETEEEFVEERFYTIPLSKAWIYPRKKRAPKATRIVKSFVTKHMKIQTIPDEDEEEAERLVISNEVNEKLWSRGIEKPPRKIRVRVVKDKEGVVTVLLAEGE
jgi:large subunit ribosomal protein L31e